MPIKSRTLSISIDSEPTRIYEFVSDPKNITKWAQGLGSSVRKAGDKWIVESPNGPAELRFSKRNEFGILDHYVKVSGQEIFVPMRVVSNGKRSEVFLTIFRQPKMTEKQFAEDIYLVEKDLKTLKNIMEKN